LLKVAVDGSVLAGDGEVEASALQIHGRIHLARPDLRCILHTHMPYATALTSIEGGRLEPVNQNALRFMGRIAYEDDYRGLALDASEGDRIASALADKEILFMANHGVLTAAPSVGAAFDDRACQNQVLATSTGGPLKRVPDDEVRRTRAAFEGDDRYGRAHFAALRRVLDREEPDYAT
jgi:ribulose-5-phosphate 4-epimerase/fuculose-1-phosphate aldolase